jgi:hypothetical protein
MVLKCGNREIEPIMPGKIPHLLSVQNTFVNATDATYEGLYSYLPDAISPNCGEVAVELYSEKSPNEPKVKVLESKTVSKIWEDFEPYRSSQPQK